MAAIVILGFVGAYFYLDSTGRGVGVADGSQQYLFISPVFAQSATTGTTFLEQEAGMSIYVNIAASIDLSKTKTVYKYIEKETSEYIVGSVFLPDLPETDDVHCFVHIDGWIVIYYSKTEPMSKIIDWNYYSGGTLTKTKLLLGLEKMAVALGANVAGAQYYHFQYPYANKWMIIIETQTEVGTDSFNLTIPSGIIVYERSWTHNGVYGKLDGTQLSVDVPHMITGEATSYWSYFRIDGNAISSIYINYDATKAARIAIVLAYIET